MTRTMKKCQDDTDSSYSFVFYKGLAPLNNPLAQPLRGARAQRKTMYELNLTLDTLPKSLNKKLRSHWRKNGRENNNWDTLIFYHCRLTLPPEPLTKARIKLVRHYYRSLDFDGVVGSLKPVVDALVTAGVLIDDSWNVLGAWEVDQKYRPKKDGSLLEISVIQCV